MTRLFSSTVFGILLPFLGTSLGALVSVLPQRRKKEQSRDSTAVTGFSAGIMTAAAVWSLLIPARELYFTPSLPGWLPCISGFLLGALFMLAAAFVTSSLPKNGSNGTFMLIFAVTVHNFPEGMAVGAALAGCRNSDSVSIAAATALCVGIAIQNLPEGAVVSLPALKSGKTKAKSLALGILSGAVEPLGAVLTLLFTSRALPVLPYLMSFAAGAMIYTVFGELLPEMYGKSTKTVRIAAVCACTGFALMMLLDMALG